MAHGSHSVNYTAAHPVKDLCTRIRHPGSCRCKHGNCCLRIDRHRADHADAAAGCTPSWHARGSLHLPHLPHLTGQPRDLRWSNARPLLSRGRIARALRRASRRHRAVGSAEPQWQAHSVQFRADGRLREPLHEPASLPGDPDMFDIHQPHVRVGRCTQQLWRIGRGLLVAKHGPQRG